MASPFANLLERIPEVFERHFVKHLDPADLVRTRAVSKACLKVVASSSRIVWLLAHRKSLMRVRCTRNGVLRAACMHAATEGNVHIFDWVSKNGSDVSYDYKQCCVAAARNGHMLMLARLWQVGIEYRSTRMWQSLWGVGAESEVCSTAAKFGHLNILKWAQMKDCGCDVYGCFRKAVFSGNLEIMQWMRNEFPDNVWDESASNSAACGGCIATLQWLMTHGCPWVESQICFYAAMSGNEQMLTWLVKIGCVFDKWTVAGAAKRGHVKILQTLRLANIPSDEMACTFAAEGGYLDTLKWLRDVQSPWDAEVCNSAAENGYLHVLKWAFEEGCPFCPDTAYELADDNHREAVCDWIRDNFYALGSDE